MTTPLESPKATTQSRDKIEESVKRDYLPRDRNSLNKLVRSQASKSAATSKTHFFDVFAASVRRSPNAHALR